MSDDSLQKKQPVTEMWVVPTRASEVIWESREGPSRPVAMLCLAPGTLGRKIQNTKENLGHRK